MHPQIHDSGEFICRQAFTPDQFQNAGLVARGQPHQLPCGRWGQQSHLEFGARFRPKLLDQGQPPADPALMPSQQLGDFDLGQSILADQGVHDPGFLDLPRPASGAVQSINRRFRGSLIGLDPPRHEPLHRLQFPRGS